MQRSTILSELISSAVEVNGLLVPAGSLEKVLVRFALNLFVANEDMNFKVSLMGSATGVRFRNREILLTTQHQLKDVDETKVSMLTDLGRKLITSGGLRKYASSSETDAYDIAAFDFTDPCNDTPELKKRFFPLSSVPPNTLNNNILAFLVIGYPSAEQVYEIHENNHLGLRRRCVVCVPDSQPMDAAILTIKSLEPLTVDPDGMSGGAVFVVQLVDGKPKAFFAGIVVRGGTQSFHILKAGFVFEFLRSAFK